jgi:hypothetical protein
MFPVRAEDCSSVFSNSKAKAGIEPQDTKQDLPNSSRKDGYGVPISPGGGSHLRIKLVAHNAFK